MWANPAEPPALVQGPVAQRIDTTLTQRYADARRELLSSLDSDRYQRRNRVKLSLLDLPFLPDELRELAPPGSLPGSPHPSRALEP